jgi:hypothetical protein
MRFYDTFQLDDEFCAASAVVGILAHEPPAEIFDDGQ